MDLTPCRHNKPTDTCHVCHASPRMETCIIYPCPSCAALRAEVSKLRIDLSNSEFTLDQVLEANKIFSEVNVRLQEAVEWAIKNVDEYVTVHCEVDEDWAIEFRRRLAVSP